MKKPIVLVIMDGVGRGDGGSGDAVKQANTPNLDKLMASCPMTWLKAHGTAVGLPTDDDMGNSEVGHNALGCADCCRASLFASNSLSLTTRFTTICGSLSSRTEMRPEMTTADVS